MNYKNHLIYFIVLWTLWDQTTKKSTPLDVFTIDLNIWDRTEINPRSDYAGSGSGSSSGDQKRAKIVPHLAPSTPVPPPDDQKLSKIVPHLAPSTPVPPTDDQKRTNIVPHLTPWTPLPPPGDIISAIADQKLTSIVKHLAPSTPAPRAGDCGGAKITRAFGMMDRIVGGVKAARNEWPWIAALFKPSGSGHRHYCGGSLITDQHVLTAAHCLEPGTQGLQVRLSMYNVKNKNHNEDLIFGAASTKINENYVPQSRENDIGIIKLDRPIKRSKSLAPICLPPAGEKFTNKTAIVIGWGKNAFAGSYMDVLYKVGVIVWDNVPCAVNYKYLEPPIEIKDSVLCASAQEKDACQGDSGGPLNCRNPHNNRWVLCGIVSEGYRCAEAEFPGIYTRVTKFLDWIKNNSI